MYNDELILIGAVHTSDDIGNQIGSEDRRGVLCDVDSIGRNEFYAASTSEVNPEIVFKMNMYEYHNERLCEFKGVKYRILRTYLTKNEFDEIELTCGKA